MDSAFIEETFKQKAKEIAILEAEKLQVKGGLIGSLEDFIEQKSLQITQQFLVEHKNLIESIQRISPLLQEEIHSLPEKEKELLQGSIDQTLQKLDIAKIEGGGLQESLGIADNFMQWLYSFGYRNYVEKNYNNAYAIFFLLTLINPSISSYRIALGFVYKELFKDSEALEAFAAAAFLDSKDPTPVYQIIELNLKCNDKEAAAKYIETLSQIVESEHLESLQSVVQDLRIKLK